MNSGIYKIINLVDMKFYLGSSANLTKRWTLHRSHLKCSKHCNVYLQRAWDKYGEINFVFTPIEEVRKELLLVREQELLDLLKPWDHGIGYNLSPSASGGDLIKNHPDKEAINQRKAEGTRRYKDSLTAEEKKTKWSKPGNKNGNWRGGTCLFTCPKCLQTIKRSSYDQKTCNKCRDRSGVNNTFYGKKHSPELLAQIKETNQIRLDAMTDEQKARMSTNKPARTVSIDGTIYPSLSAAARAMNLTPGAVSHRLKSNYYPNEFYIK